MLPEQLPTTGSTVRPATLDDVEGYVRCHVACLAETYASIMPLAFAEQHRQAVGQRIEDTRRSWDRGLADGHGTGAWLSVDQGGEVVGVVRSGPGPLPWETELGAPPPQVDFQLHHLYTRRRMHGSGLGRALLETAIGPRDAYLWILFGNPRAERFYRRNGFVAEDVTMDCGPTWFHRPMFRMLRGTGG